MPNTTRGHLTYIWLDADCNLRQKVKIHNLTIWHDGVHLVPEWNYDGSSTGQADRNDSEVILKPVKMYPNHNPNVDRTLYDTCWLVLCECYLPNGEPHPTNYRFKAKQVFDKLNDKYEPWYGTEQEFFITDASGTPLDFNENDKQGRFYCQVDSCLNKLIQEMIDRSIKTELNVVGSNLEVAPGQAEIQIFGKGGIKSCDDIIILRYIMIQVAQEYGYLINFHPKPLEGDWNGSGAHVNYSTIQMRQQQDDSELTPYHYISHAISKLEEHHHKHINVYGVDNDKRLTGEHETSSVESFSYGVANRGSSIRIPQQVYKDQKGYIEDRRPASNFNPYLVLPLLLETTTLDL